MVSFLRVIKFAFQNLVRNGWLTVATVSVLTLTLVSVNVLIVLNLLGKVALSTVRDKIDVSVHFKPEVEDSRVQTVKIFLLSLPEVKDVEHVTPAEALESFSENYKDDEEVLASLGEVGENPFGATLVIKARSLEDYPKIMESLSDPLYVDLIEAKDHEDRQAMITRVESVSGRLEGFGLLVSGVFAFITLLIVYNTIRMSIFTRKDEISIMRFVGASDWFIRAPFYVEAFLWSVLALAASLAITWPAMRFAQPHFQQFFGAETIDIAGFYTANFGKIVGSQLVASFLVAVATTKAATAKYLKV